MNEDKIYLKSWIYKLINKINNKIYIGSTVDLVKRMSKHKNSSRCSKNMKIINAIKKYGWNNFDKEIIEVLENKSLKELLDREEYWISKYNSIDKNIGYNTLTRAFSRAGVKCSEKHKQYLSKIFSGKNHPQYGIPKSKETREKISKTLKGKYFRTTKAVKQIDIITNNIIKIFPSIKNASENMNGNHSLIILVCQGKRKSAYGYKWQYN